MSNYNWCHGPECHTQHTQSRIRGSGRDKVLRTVKIKVNRFNGYQSNIWNYFCNNSCLFQFLHKFGQQIANTYPVKQPSETPINVEVKQYPDSAYSYYQGKTFKQITIK